MHHSIPVTGQNAQQIRVGRVQHLMTSEAVGYLFVFRDADRKALGQNVSAEIQQCLQAAAEARLGCSDIALIFEEGIAIVQRQRLDLLDKVAQHLESVSDDPPGDPALGHGWPRVISASRSRSNCLRRCSASRIAAFSAASAFLRSFSLKAKIAFSASLRRWNRALSSAFSIALSHPQRCSRR